MVWPRPRGSIEIRHQFLGTLNEAIPQVCHVPDKVKGEMAIYAFPGQGFLESRVAEQRLHLEYHMLMTLAHTSGLIPLLVRLVKDMDFLQYRPVTKVGSHPLKQNTTSFLRQVGWYQPVSVSALQGARRVLAWAWPHELAAHTPVVVAGCGLLLIGGRTFGFAQLRSRLAADAASNVRQRHVALEQRLRVDAILPLMR